MTVKDQSRPRSCPYVDVSDTWDEAVAYEEAKLAQELESEKCFNKHSNRDGYLGEAALARLTGLKQDKLIRIEGDSGRDFAYGGETYNIKASTYTTPDIIEYPENNPNGKKRKKKPDIYIVAHIVTNESRKTAMVKIVGWCTLAQMKEDHITKNYIDEPNGDRDVITYQYYQKNKQIGLPPKLATLANARMK